eukprot:TRINITY_DN32853_c0_g1_i1.p1 TRINITY_DN32853_c0_g1~~TRINITY_DN32853_c0_g1_i1.p1  ORF type:complete len:418 (+),score=95.26 TRINITY_DN32853_c0_g1_i1:65-1318(+)
MPGGWHWDMTSWWLDGRRAVAWAVVWLMASMIGIGSVASDRIDLGLEKKGQAPIALDVITPQDLEAHPEWVQRYEGMPLLLHQQHKHLGALDYNQKVLMKTWEDNYANATGWRHVFWSDDDNIALIKKHTPWLLETYQAYPHYIQRADISRMAVLYAYGGVYADTDFECRAARCMDRAYENNCTVTVVASPRMDVDGFFQNSMMASRDGTAAKAWWERALRYAMDHASRGGVKKSESSILGKFGQGMVRIKEVLMSTGPYLYTLIFAADMGLDVGDVSRDDIGTYFASRGIDAPEQDAPLCRLPELEYNGQRRPPTPRLKTYHHNLGNWVVAMRKQTLYFPRLLPSLAALAPLPFLDAASAQQAPLAAFLMAFTAVAYCIYVGFPAEGIEATCGAVWLVVLYLLKRSHLRRRRPCCP